ncbi:MAG: hypothetical protein ABUL66_04685, partial [Verrucomicrobiota bacterium]
VINEYIGVAGAELNIDGEKFALTPLQNITDMNDDFGIKTSSRTFQTSLATVEKIIHSKRTWIRVNTPTGALENAVIDGDKDSKAYNALIRFMNAVKANSNLSQ